MGSQVTYNYDLQAEDIARRQKIAEAMQQESLQPIQQAQSLGPMASQTSWTNGLAKMVQAYLGAKEQAKASEEKSALSDRYQQDLTQGMQQYDKTSRGYSSPGDTPLPEGIDGPVRQAENIPADPRKAVMDAMASNHPVLRDFAMKQMAEQAKGQVTPKDLLAHANPATVFAHPSDPSKWTGKANLKAITPGDVVLDENSGALVNPTVPNGAGFTTKSIDGDMYQESPFGLKKLDNAPKVTLNTGEQAGTKFATKLAEKRADTLAKSYDDTKGLPSTLSTLDEASQSLSAGIKSGATAEIALTLAKLGKALGFGEVTPEIANTEAFKSQMAKSTLEVLKTLRPASDKDVEYAEKASGGKITLDDSTMLRLIDSARAAAASKLYSHNQLLESNKKASGALPEDLDTFNVPFSVSGDNMTFKDGQFQATSRAPQTATSQAAPAIPGVRKFNPQTGRIE